MHTSSDERRTCSCNLGESSRVRPPHFHGCVWLPSWLALGSKSLVASAHRRTHKHIEVIPGNDKTAWQLCDTSTRTKRLSSTNLWGENGWEAWDSTLVAILALISEFVHQSLPSKEWAVMGLVAVVEGNVPIMVPLMLHLVVHWNPNHEVRVCRWIHVGRRCNVKLSRRIVRKDLRRI